MNVIINAIVVSDKTICIIGSNDSVGATIGRNG
jgi:hypothetical protein